MNTYRGWSLRGLLTVGVVSLLSIFLAPAGSTFAAPTAGATFAAHDVTVVVVRDVTPVGCALTYGNHVGTPRETRTAIPCPAGTLMAVLHVPESEAIAKHEAYVVMPLASSSQAQQAQAGKQIDALVAATNARLHPSQAGEPASPLSYCNQRSQSLSGSWVWGGNYWNSAVWWDTNTDCSIYIYHSQLQGTASTFAIYWGQDKYASWSRGWGCIYLGTNTLNQYPNTVQTAGYNYQQWLYNGSHCTIFDDARYTVLGPLYD